MQIRALSESDDRSRFRSGDPDLDRFLQRFAGQNQFRHYVGVNGESWSVPVFAPVHLAPARSRICAIAV